MAVPRPRPPLAQAGSALLLLLLLLLLAAGCAGETGPAAQAPPPGFTADTFTPEGLIGGATATEAGCRMLPDAVWVDTGDRRECMRFAAGGTARAGRTALVHIPGDPPGVVYGYAAGEASVDRVDAFYEHTAASRRLAAEALAGAMGDVPVFLIARAGMHGSSGHHARDRHSREAVALVDAALTELKRRHGLRDFALSGFSSGGLVVANLLALRADIRCAAIASAPLDLALYYRAPDGTVPDYFATRRAELADPLRTVREVRSDATVFVVGDARDRRVPHAAWSGWIAEARRHGLRVYDAETTGGDLPALGAGRSYHVTGSRALEVAHACAAGVPDERIRRALGMGEPILRPRGRRLAGAEIREALAGRRLGGIVWPQWGTRVTVSTFWGAEGERHQFHPAHPERRIAADRWWVEGDRLCTSGDGCHPVLEDGRLLHVVEGEPPRFRMTFVAGAPSG